MDGCISRSFLSYKYCQRTDSLSFSISFLKLNPAEAIVKLMASPICPLRKFIAAL